MPPVEIRGATCNIEPQTGPCVVPTWTTWLTLLGSYFLFPFCPSWHFFDMLWLLALVAIGLGYLVWRQQNEEIYSLVSPDRQSHYVGGYLKGYTVGAFFEDGKDYVNNHISLHGIRQQVSDLRAQGWTNDAAFAQRVL